MSGKPKYLAAVVLIGLSLAAGRVYAQAATAEPATSGYKPTIDDWVGVNAAVNNYSMGLDQHDPARFDKAFWPEATITAQPEPGKSFSMPYRKAEEPPPAPTAGTARHNAIGTDIAPWHLPLSHNFEFQDATHATHYGYFLSIYPDLKTKITTVGLPGHYSDTLQKRHGEWRILQRVTVIGDK